ncbi:MAG: hypothetical protein E7673_06425 [Ruminococcaceae bacterium]|nr:hypothetical protein [Oscillospiraceae bacterium]
MNIGLILSAVFFVILALAALVGYRKGKKFVWQYTLTKLLINVIAVIIAIPVTKLVARLIINLILGNGDVIASLSSATEIVKALGAMVLGLFIFFFVRLIIKFVLKFFVPALSELLISLTSRREKDSAPEYTADEFTGDGDTADSSVVIAEEKPKKSRGSKKGARYSERPQLASILIGVFGCIFGVAVLFAPFTGMIGLVDDSLSAIDISSIEGMEENEEALEIYDMVKGITSNASVKVCNAIGGKLIFNGLTTYKVAGEKIKLANEAELVSTIGSSSITLMNDKAEKEAKKSSVDDILNAFDKSSIIPIVLSDVVNQAAEAFDRGESFMGVESPLAKGEQNEAEKAGIGEKLLPELVNAFKGCTPDSIKKDIRTIGSFAIILIDHDAINTVSKDPAKLLSEDALVEELLAAFFENDRLSSLVSTFVEIGIDMLYETLGIADDLSKPYGNLQDDLSSIRNRIDGSIVTPTSTAVEGGETSALTSDEEIKKAVRKTFNAYGIDITDEGVAEVTATLKKATSSVNDALKNVKINSKDADDGKKTVDLTTLESFEEHSLLLTKKDVKITHVTSIADPKKEAKSIATALGAIAKLSDKVGGEESNVTAILSTAGELLDNLAGTEIIGKETVDKLVVVMFQSEKATEVFSGNVVAVTNAVNSMISNNNSGNGEGGYKDAMDNIAGMVDTMTSISDSEDPKALVESLTETLKGMSPETAEATKHLMGNPEFVEKLGVGAESSEGVADLISNLFDTIANARKSEGLGLTEDEYKAETESIANLLETTINMSESNDEPKEDEIKKYYTQALDSKILTHTITGTVLDMNGNVIEAKLDPLNLKVEFTDNEDKESFVAELNEQLAQRIAEIEADATIADKAEAKKNAAELAVAVAAFAGLKTAVNGNAIVLR